MTLIKDDSILQIVSYLEKQLGKDNFQIADYWDADLCAIGLTDTNSNKLIYISTYNKKADTFYVEIEKTRNTSGDKIIFEVVSKGQLLQICKEKFLTN